MHTRSDSRELAEALSIDQNYLVQQLRISIKVLLYAHALRPVITWVWPECCHYMLHLVVYEPRGHELTVLWLQVSNYSDQWKHMHPRKKPQTRLHEEQYFIVILADYSNHILILFFVMYLLIKS